MFNSPVLDLIILLSFIYFVGSLILSSVNESIAGIFRLRPAQLETALKNLFFDTSATKNTNSDTGSVWSKWIDNTLMKSPHIQSLMKASDKYPAYIPAKNFVLAIIGELGSANYTSADLQNAIATSSMPDPLKKVLVDLAASASNDINSFEKNVEEFYNNAMDRAGGVYKKKIRVFLFVIGFLVACFLNLDTIKIIQDELANKAKLSQDVDNIIKQLPKVKVGKDSVEITGIDMNNGKIAVKNSVQPTSATKTSSNAVLKIDTTKSAGKQDTARDKSKEIIKNVKAVDNLTLYLGQTSGYTTGYSADGGAVKQWGFDPKDARQFFKKLLGILITAFALQLSSGFWFDLLNKAVNLRSAGKKPDTDQKKN